jgi:hypothetical protein
MEGGGGGVLKPLKDKTQLDIKISGPATPLDTASYFLMADYFHGSPISC